MIEIFDPYFKADLDKFIGERLTDALLLGAKPEEFCSQLTKSYERVMLRRMHRTQIDLRRSRLNSNSRSTA